MEKNINMFLELLKGISTIIGIAITIYGVPYLVRKGWGDAENRTKKVCDMCFRDIKKWNDVCEK